MKLVAVGLWFEPCPYLCMTRSTRVDWLKSETIANPGNELFINEPLSSVLKLAIAPLR
jgi:hypothetical protein